MTECKKKRKMGNHIVNNIIARTVMTRNLVETWNEMPDAEVQLQNGR